MILDRFLVPGLGVLLALATAAAGVQTWRLGALEREVAEERAAKIAAALALSENHRATEAKLTTNTRRAADALTAQLRAADAAAAGLADDHRRLLDALGAGGNRPAEDSAAACRGYAERVRLLEGILAEGAGLAAEGAPRVVRLDARLSGLQQYAAGLEPVTSGAAP
jgi:hypothetical protein